MRPKEYLIDSETEINQLTFNTQVGLHQTKPFTEKVSLNSKFSGDCAAQYYYSPHVQGPLVQNDVIEKWSRFGSSGFTPVSGTSSPRLN